MMSAEQEKTIHFDPRTKIILLIFSMIIATTAPDLRFECVLILLIAGLGILCGKFDIL